VISPKLHIQLVSAICKRREQFHLRLPIGYMPKRQ
jgi:hypothetical protein